MELDACNRIYVIESLRDNDNKTGTKLYNNILSQSWCISSKLYIVEDKKGWDDAINLIKEAAIVGRNFLIAFFPSKAAPIEIKASGDVIVARLAIVFSTICGKETLK